MSTPTLWQFRHSHFNDKVRWALDWKGIAHVRRSLVAGLHIPRMLLLTGQKQVPALVLDGEVVHDSTRIIAALEQRWPTPALYPSDELERQRALVLEDFCDEELGPHVRRAIFAEMLPDTAYSAALLTTGESAAFQALYRAGFPAIRMIIKLDLGIDARGVEQSRQKIEAGLDRIAAELQPSGYLVGDRFSVADLTAAALLAPLFFPPEYPYPLPGPAPDRVRAFQDRFAAHRGIGWAAEMYRRHRGTSAEIATAA